MTGVGSLGDRHRIFCILLCWALSAPTVRGGACGPQVLRTRGYTIFGTFSAANTIFCSLCGMGSLSFLFATREMMSRSGRTINERCDVILMYLLITAARRSTKQKEALFRALKVPNFRVTAGAQHLRM